MASPNRSKMSLFPEAVYGQPNTTTGGRGYQITGDGGWRPLTDHKEAAEQYTGAEAPLSDAVATVVRAWEGSYTRFLRTHGEELWWRWAIGDFQPASVAAGSLWSKTYRTHRRGPQGSYTIVQDRFTLGSTPGLYKSVYRGCKVRSWSLQVTQDQPVQIGADFISQRSAVTSGGSAPALAPYPAATVGKPAAFTWADTRLRIGAAGQRANFQMDFCRFFRYSQDNRLDLSRYYVDGDSNLAEPVAQDTNTGSLALEFDYAAVVDTNILDRFDDGELISVELSGNRPGGYAYRLWLPTVHLSNVQVEGGVRGAASVSATGGLRWNEAASDSAASLTLTTEGRNP